MENMTMGVENATRNLMVKEGSLRMLSSHLMVVYILTKMNISQQTQL